MANFNEVKEKVSLPDAIKLLSLSLTEKEGVFRGKCPTCNAGGERALVVTPGKGFYCFHKKQGGDVIALASHIRGIPVKEAAEWLLKPTEESATSTLTTSVGLKPLDYLDPTHEKVLEIVSEETARFWQMGYANKGIMRGTVAVPLYDAQGVLVAYVGIEADGSYRFPANFPSTAHIFNANRIITNEVYLLPTVQDVLRASESGIDQAICFFNTLIDPVQLKALADLLEDRKSLLIL